MDGVDEEADGATAVMLDALLAVLGVRCFAAKLCSLAGIEL